MLEAIYEEDFVGFSYGFRPGRDQHCALNALSVGFTRMAGFQHKDEAERIMAELSERLKLFGQSMHPEKTRLLEFGRSAQLRSGESGQVYPNPRRLIF